MDLAGVYIPTWCIVILAIMAIIYLYCTWRFKELELLGVKGPKPHPFLGSLREVTRLGMHNFHLKLIQEYGPISGYFLGRTPQMLIADPELLKQIFVQDFNSFQDHQRHYLQGLLKHDLFMVEGSDWHRIRVALSPTFTVNKLKLMVRAINTSCEALVGNIEKAAKSKSSFDPKELSEIFVMDAFVTVGFGLRMNLQVGDHNHVIFRYTKVLCEVFATTSTAFLLSYYAPFIARILEWMNVAYYPAEVETYFTDLIEKAMEAKKSSEKKQPDLLQLMMDLEEQMETVDTNDPTKLTSRRALTHKEILAQCILFLASGHATTATTMGMTMYCLATNSHCQDKLYQEIHEALGEREPSYDEVSRLPYLDMCFNETLRLYPPIFYVERQCTEETTLGGVRIPKGMIVNIPMYAMHHDPNAWKDPAQYNPERFSPENKHQHHEFQFLAFGHGPRECIGKRLAQLEMRLALVKIIQNFKLTSSKGQRTLKFEQSKMLQPEGGVWLNAEKRNGT